MRRDVLVIALAVGGALGAAFSSGCGLDENGTATDAGGSDVTTSDASHRDAAVADVGLADAAPSMDAGPDAAMDSALDCGTLFTCGSTCVGGGCFACPQFPVQCNGDRTCGVDCSSCAGLPFDCAYCTDAGSRSQVCQPDEAQCAVPSCPCADGDAGDCVAATQVCFTMGPGPNLCGYCGDPASMGKTCQNGLTCDMATGTCH